MRPVPRAVLPTLCALCLGLGACSSAPGAPPSSLDAARAAQARVDQAAASRTAFDELAALNRLVAEADVAWRNEDAEEARRRAEEALATVQLIEARLAAARAADERDAVAATITRLRSEVGLGWQAAEPGGRP